MIFSLAEYLTQLHLTQLLDQKQFQKVIDEIIRERWMERLLGTMLLQELINRLKKRSYQD